MVATKSFTLDGDKVCHAVANPNVGPGEMLKIADLLVRKKIGVDTAENRHHCEGPGVRRTHRNGPPRVINSRRV